MTNQATAAMSTAHRGSRATGCPIRPGCFANAEHRFPRISLSPNAAHQKMRVALSLVVRCMAASCHLERRPDDLRQAPVSVGSLLRGCGDADRAATALAWSDQRGYVVNRELPRSSPTSRRFSTSRRPDTRPSARRIVKLGHAEAMTPSRFQAPQNVGTWVLRES
jgi:hypothetical protein